MIATAETAARKVRWVPVSQMPFGRPRTTARLITQAPVSPVGTQEIHDRGSRRRASRRSPARSASVSHHGHEHDREPGGRRYHAGHDR